MDYDEDLPKMITTDIQRLNQILINLIGNAIKFTFKGRISLSVSVNYSRFNGIPHLQLIVRDTGIGIRQEDKNKIF